MGAEGCECTVGALTVQGEVLYRICIVKGPMLQGLPTRRCGMPMAMPSLYRELGIWL
jgi:hypothetical protein